MNFCTYILAYFLTPNNTNMANLNDLDDSIQNLTNQITALATAQQNVQVATIAVAARVAALPSGDVDYQSRIDTINGQATVVSGVTANLQDSVTQLNAILPA